MIIQLTSAAVIALPLPEHRVDGDVVYALKPLSALQINATPDGLAGQKYTFKVTVLGNFVVTFGTNIISSGTLTTGAVDDRVFTVSFVSDGQKLVEVGRTAVMVA